jgi:hypothetical protein
VEADPEADDRHTLAKDYRDRALEAVHQTLQMLPPPQRPTFWRNHIVPDAALEPIRNEARFQRLAEEFAACGMAPPAKPQAANPHISTNPKTWRNVPVRSEK